MALAQDFAMTAMRKQTVTKHSIDEADNLFPNEDGY